MLSALPQFKAHPCGTDLPADGVRCGTVAVPENRNQPRSRKIDLNVIVIPATSGRTRSPLFDIDGGPGLADTKNAGFYLTDGKAYHEHRDIVLVDQRGTGRSHPLDCPELSSPGYKPLYPPDAVARCRRLLERTSDLTQYGTDAAVADLDSVRAALGYETIDLYGMSYGTLVGLRYLAAHPERVHAAVLVSVAPPMTMPPRYHAGAAERGLRALFDKCTADAACGAAFSPDRDLSRAVAKLPSIKGAPARETFFEKLRTLMYQPATAFQIPYIVHRAAAGNLKPFLKLTATGPGGFHYFDGMLLSVTCSESFGLFDYRTARAAARKTSFGDYRLRRQHDACAVWPKAKVSREFLAPVRAKVPVLIVSGELDPVTPPDWAAKVAGDLVNSRQVVIPNMGHSFDGLDHIECFDAMVLRFYETADPTGIDTRCVRTMTPPPFKIRD